MTFAEYDVLYDYREQYVLFSLTICLWPGCVWL